MTAEEIKRIVDDERAEQLTAQLCRHWEVATDRLDELVQDLAADMDTCIEAEIYAAIMRMQSTIMALTELNKMPCAFLFTEYFNRITNTVSNERMRKAVMTLLEQLLKQEPTKHQNSFFDLVTQSLTQHFALLPEKQKAMEEKVSATQHIFAVCAQHLNPNDLMMVASVIQSLNTDDDMMSQEEITAHLMKMRQAMDGLADKMDENLQYMMIWLLLLMLLPTMIVSMMRQNQTNGKAMTHLFNKVLRGTRESDAWWAYWKERRDTLRVVNDKCSWNDIMTTERGKEHEELGKVAGGLFAKWTTNPEAFESDFLDTHLNDDELRSFIFHLATLSEIARELNPTTKFGDEQLVNNDLQRIGEAVMTAARQLNNLVTEAWFPHYEAMWQELIENEEIFNHLKVTRKSPHNNLFTARFFCHLMGEMKKRAIFGGHSDNDLAEKLTEKRSVGTFRKNIQEGMSKESESVQKIFDTIYQKHNDLAHPKK